MEITDCGCDNPKGPAADCEAGQGSKLFPLKTAELKVLPIWTKFHEQHVGL